MGSGKRVRPTPISPMTVDGKEYIVGGFPGLVSEGRLDGVHEP